MLRRVPTTSAGCSAGEPSRAPPVIHRHTPPIARPMMRWLAELDGRRIVVEVPASSANLGAGYDCLAMALDLVNRIELEVRGWSRGEVELSVEGEGIDELP